MKIIITSILLLASIFVHSQRLETPTLSPFSKISQEIGLTVVSLEYSRPSAKGRKIFGELVPYDKIWRTGANASTKITFTEAANIGGNSIEAGTYAIYTIPGKEKWTIIIHSNIKMRSLAGKAYDSSYDVFRFEVKPLQVEHYLETYSIQFSDLRTNSCNLQMQWASTLVKIPITVEVDQKIEQQMAVFLQNPDSIPHRTYFEAAQYYLNNDKDLDEALRFIDSALKKSPENFRYGLLKSKIQDKNEDTKGALVTINQASSWAKKTNNDNYIEQTTLYKQYLLLKK